jgi:hypothetical protein
MFTATDLPSLRSEIAAAVRLAQRHEHGQAHKGWA